MSKTNGTATPAAAAEPAAASQPTTGAVIGINLGHSYGSIACINQHGRADVIANEDGERQLATRISYNGDQVYIGNQATPQLVRNAKNTVDRFVNLLGRSFSDLSEDEKKRSSAAVVDVNGVPSFNVEIDGKASVLSAHDVAVRFLRSLFLTAKEFLSGVPIDGAVLSVPPNFTAQQIAALRKAAEEAGLIVLQLIPAPAAAVTAYGLTEPGAASEHAGEYAPGTELDRTVAVVDMGGSSTDVTILGARAGLYTLLSHARNSSLGGAALDDALVAFLAKEFTKKTKIAIGPEDARAWAKLRNEAENTKRALSASGSAQCSVESLAEGMDFSTSVNRVRLNLLGAGVYRGVQAVVEDALKQAGIEAAQVDEVILAGGSARLPGVEEQLRFLFPEDGPGATTSITASIDSDQVLARGCAIHAHALAAITEEGAPEKKHALGLPAQPPSAIDALRVPSTTRPLGLVLPAPKEGSAAQASIDGELFVTLVPAHTPLPARRTFTLPVPAGASSALLDVAEGTPEVRVDTITPEADEDDEDDEPPEPEEVRTARVRADKKRVAQLAVPVEKDVKSIAVYVEVAVDGAVTVKASKAPGSEPLAQISLPAPK